jgi:hypothetical protein
MFQRTAVIPSHTDYLAFAQFILAWAIEWQLENRDSDSEMKGGLWAYSQYAFEIWTNFRWFSRTDQYRIGEHLAAFVAVTEGEPE